MSPVPEKILFYDGYCAICNKWVRWVRTLERRSEIFFAPLSGTTAQDILPKEYPEFSRMSTLIYYRRGRVFTRSRAVLELLKDCGFPAVLGYIGMIIPAFVRDGVYDWVAKNRFRYYKQLESCPLPPESWRKYFLP